MQFMFKFIYRYSEVFNMVSSCYAADVPSASCFVPNPMSHVSISGRNRFSYPCQQFFQTCRKICNKNFVFKVSSHIEVQRCWVRRSWWPSYRTTTSNPSNHRVIEVVSNFTVKVRGVPYLVEKLNFYPYLAVAVACQLQLVNPLKTKSRLLYLKTQFVLCSKHFSSRL